MEYKFVKGVIAMKVMKPAVAVVLLFLCFSFAYADTLIYDNNKNLMYRIRDNQVYDADGNKAGYVKGSKIYDKDKNPLYRFKGSRIYDDAGNAVGRKREVPSYGPRLDGKY